MIVVSNTSPLSSLATIVRLSLLQEIYGNIIIPTAVASEITNAGTENVAVTEVLTQDWINIQPLVSRTLAEELQYVSELHIGEAEAILLRRRCAIALAIELEADLLLIDEELGREVAAE